jgi:hypothetical protein
MTKEKVAEGMFIDVRDTAEGFEVWMENVSSDLYDCTLNFSKSKNLSMETIDSKVKVAEPMVATFTAKAGSNKAYVKLPVVDKSLGECKFLYKFKGGKSVARPGKPLEDAKKAADDDNAAKKAAAAPPAPAKPTRYKSSGDCIQCHKEITDASFLSLGDKKMHKSCLPAYEFFMKNKCEQCTGQLPSSYIEFGPKGAGWGVKLHDECLTPYKEATRPNCTTCGKQILDNKRLERKGMHYHTACLPPG